MALDVGARFGQQSFQDRPRCFLMQPMLGVAVEEEKVSSRNATPTPSAPPICFKVLGSTLCPSSSRQTKRAARRSPCFPETNRTPPGLRSALFLADFAVLLRQFAKGAPVSGQDLRAWSRSNRSTRAMLRPEPNPPPVAHETADGQPKVIADHDEALYIGRRRTAVGLAPVRCLPRPSWHGAIARIDRGRSALSGPAPRPCPPRRAANVSFNPRSAGTVGHFFRSPFKSRVSVSTAAAST